MAEEDVILSANTGVVILWKDRSESVNLAKFYLIAIYQND